VRWEKEPAGQTQVRRQGGIQREALTQRPGSELPQLVEGQGLCPPARPSRKPWTGGKHGANSRGTYRGESTRHQHALCARNGIPHHPTAPFMPVRCWTSMENQVPTGLCSVTSHTALLWALYPVASHQCKRTRWGHLGCPPLEPQQSPVLAL
jgi:hypothetical protein